MHICEESMTPPRLFFDDELSSPPNSVHVHVESLTPPPLLFDSSRGQKRAHEDEVDTDVEGEEEPTIDDAHPWEHEICKTLNPQVEIHGWKELHNQIKKDLKKEHSMLPLSQINQLMILCNFATLRLKGHSWMSASEEISHQWHEKDGVHFAHCIRALACHYQLFEQLPVER